MNFDRYILCLQILFDGSHLPGVLTPAIHELLDVLVVGREPHVVVHVALGFEGIWRNDFAESERFRLLPDSGDVFHGIFELFL